MSSEAPGLLLKGLGMVIAFFVSHPGAPMKENKVMFVVAMFREQRGGVGCLSCMQVDAPALPPCVPGATR